MVPPPSASAPAAGANDPGAPTLTSRKRVKNVSVERRIVHGSVAVWRGHDAGDEQTHRWTCYVRGEQRRGAEDISKYVSKVEFHLHDSFEPPVRTVTEPPFEVSELGWGEFEILVRIHFADEANERPVDVYHPLRLFPAAGEELSAKPVTVEYLDAVVFVDPTEKQYKALQEDAAPLGSGDDDVGRAAHGRPHSSSAHSTAPSSASPATAYSVAEHFTDLDDVESRDMQRVLEARANVRKQTLDLQKRYEAAEREGDELRAAALRRRA